MNTQALILLLIILVHQSNGSLHTTNFKVMRLQLNLPSEIDETNGVDVLTLRFCAGARIRSQSSHKDCQYLLETVNWTSRLEEISFPLKTIWPTTPWQFLVSGFSSNGTLLFEFPSFYKEIHAQSGQFAFHRENANYSLSADLQIQCEPHWFGPSCRKFCIDKPGNGSLTYICLPSGEKLCRSGWSGPDCTVPLCQNPCVHGTCIGPNVCNCAIGWKGSFCESCIPLTGCQHGFCASAGQCICQENWTGKYCNQEIDFCRSHAGVCLNGGTCSSAGMKNSYYCNCTREYTGANCESYRAPSADSCAELDCGSGYCISSYGKARCICPEEKGNCLKKGETVGWLNSPLIIPFLLLIFTSVAFLLMYSCGNCCKRITINCIFCSAKKDDIDPPDEDYGFVIEKTEKRSNIEESGSISLPIRSPPPAYNQLDFRLLRNSRRLPSPVKGRPDFIYHSTEQGF